MTERIRQIHVMSDCTYGRARVQAELRDMGLCVNHKRIGRANLQGVSRRRGYVVTTQRDRHAKAAPDLVKRQFTATGINQLSVADMTYVPTWVGFLYLAVVVDVCSRKVVGWSFGERMTSDLVIAALNMALHIRRPASPPVNAGNSSIQAQWRKLSGFSFSAVKFLCCCNKLPSIAKPVVSAMCANA